MMSDYHFPSWFWDEETTDQDRHDWMIQERCRRQAMRQQTAYQRRVEKQVKRKQRREKADSGMVSVEEYR